MARSASSILRFLVFCGAFLPCLVFAQSTDPTKPDPKMDRIMDEMDKFLAPLKKQSGWIQFIAEHPDLFGSVDEKNPASVLGVSDFTVKIDGDEYKVGFGCRSIWVAAPVKTVMDVVNNPHHFTSMYGLDKPAAISPVASDGSYDALVYKLVPGIETQDYTLHYTGFKDGDAWIEQARQIRDEKGFALRDNVKIVAPSGSGSVFREVSLLYPRRWWVRLMHGLAQSIFKRELGKLNRSLKCASERVQKGEEMTDDLAKLCYKESQN